MKREDRDDIRRRALARAEIATRDRLLAMRSELNALASVIDRITLPRRPRMRASASADLGLLGNLLTFPRRPRGKL